MTTTHTKILIALTLAMTLPHLVSAGETEWHYMYYKTPSSIL
jgi:hypothetical protein